MRAQMLKPIFKMTNERTNTEKKNITRDELVEANDTHAANKSEKDQQPINSTQRAQL